MLDNADGFGRATIHSPRVAYSSITQRTSPKTATKPNLWIHHQSRQLK
jgi:hypothetical protein